MRGAWLGDAVSVPSPSFVRAVEPGPGRGPLPPGPVAPRRPSAPPPRPGPGTQLGPGRTRGDALGLAGRPPAGSGRVAGRGGAGDPPGRLIPAARVPAAPRAEFHQRRRGARGAPRRPRGGLRRPGPRVRPAAGAAGAGAGPEQAPRPSRGAAGGARRGDGAGARRDPGVSASCRRAAIRLPAAEPVHVQPRPRR